MNSWQTGFVLRCTNLPIITLS